MSGRPSCVAFEQRERERHRLMLRRELLGLILNYDPEEIRLALDLYDSNPKQFSEDVIREMISEMTTEEIEHSPVIAKHFEQRSAAKPV
jgi:hypothetical protein